MSDFLLELGTEEIPAGYIQPALEQGISFFHEYLKERQLSYKDIKKYATPRRMIFFITDLPEIQANIEKEIIGPPASVAFDSDNKPTPAYNGFIKRYNLSSSDIKIKDTSKGKVCYASLIIKSEKTEKILAESIIALIKSLSFPKSMWWSDKTLTFARPLRYILAVFDKKPIKVSLTGVASGNETFGHPFISNNPITITSSNFETYQNALRKTRVIIDHNERRDIIEKEIKRITKKYDAICNELELLDEVINLVEYPTVIECKFDESFLKLPEAVIESAMKLHQRYFPLKDKNGRLLSHFIVVSNNPDSKNSALIKEGNERVLKARLSDAVFFWEQDRKISLDAYAKRLDTISFLGVLGTAKLEQIKGLATFIAANLGHPFTDDIKIIESAANLCKADLLTGMVGEFPDLQGIIGYEYLKDKEPDVALAIKEHYQPRFSGDALPKSNAGICLSLAEKFDNLTTCFSRGLIPTGSADPYGLRRQTRAIIDIILFYSLRKLNSLNKIVSDSINFSKSAIENSENTRLSEQIISFIRERLIQIYLDKKYNIDFINATVNAGFDNLFRFDLRLKSLQSLPKESFWNELVEVVERTYNIGKNTKVDGEVNEILLKEKEEIEFWNAYKDNKDAIQKLIDAEQYEEASRLYHKVFAKPAHTFFDKVFVNVKEDDIRSNRILLNKKINQLYSSQIADLSKIPRKR
ncbi:MAG: glycine--tRNA ligase subunit beta [Planctomycetota bacterium]